MALSFTRLSVQEYEREYRTPPTERNMGENRSSTPAAEARFVGPPAGQLQARSVPASLRCARSRRPSPSGPWRSLVRRRSSLHARPLVELLRYAPSTSASLDETTHQEQGTDAMWYGILSVLALVVFAIMMGLRGELSSVAARAVMAAAAFGFAAVAWICVAKFRAGRSRRDPS